MKQITVDNLDDLAIGSAILGSGGGGDPTYFHMIAKHQLEKSGPVPLITLEEVGPEELVMPIGFIGAPLAETEKFPSGREFLVLFDVLEKTLKRKVDVVMPMEIGGAVAFPPINVAAQLGLRVLDADMLGRAFPERHMTSANVLGLKPSPLFLVDALGNAAVLHAKDALAYEKIGRKVTIAMGSWAAEAAYPLLGKQVAQYTIPKTVSKALSIGKAHRKARNQGKDPLAAVLQHCKGTFIGSGKIVDIDRVIDKGFVQGKVVLKEDDDIIEIEFQNEYLIAKCNGSITATTPDILMLLEEGTGTPILTEALQFGLKVNLIAMPSPEIWTTPAGLELVCPRYFGYEIDYKPIEKAL